MRKKIKEINAKESLHEFVRYFWNIVEPSMPLIENWHIDSICDFLMAVHIRKIKRGIINIPPGHAKSNLVSVLFPAFRWLSNPMLRSLYATYENRLAMRDSMRTRDLIQSSAYQALISPTGAPDWVLKEDSNRQDLFTNTQSGYRMATTTGGRGTGWRVDDIVIDDPINSIDAKSELARDANIYWLTKAIATRLKDPREGSILLIMQRLHDDDLTGYIETKIGGFETLKLPSRYIEKDKSVVRSQVTPYEIITQDKRIEDGELLFPLLYTEKVLTELEKILTPKGFAEQHQQKTSPEQGNIFKKSFWRFYTVAGALRGIRPVGCYQGEPKLLPDLDTTILSLDATFKDGPKNDFVCFLIIGVKGADRFILDRVKLRLNFPDTLLHFKTLCRKWPKVFQKLVEDKANGSAIIATLKSEIAGIIEIQPQGGKESRANAIAWQVESGNVYLPDNADWLEDFIHELSVFPNGSHDDQVDSLSQALIYLNASTDVIRARAMCKR